MDTDWGLRKKPRVLSTKKPTMRDIHGRTWDSHIEVILPNGSKTKGYMDTTWGRYIYFHDGNHWWKIDNMALEGLLDDLLDLRKWWRPRMKNIEVRQNGTD